MSEGFGPALHYLRTLHRLGRAVRIARGAGAAVIHNLSDAVLFRRRRGHNKGKALVARCGGIEHAQKPRD
jgi:hypothetical protein